jgi:HSP20 family protein
MTIKDKLPWNRSSNKVEIIPVQKQNKNELDIFDQTWNQWMNEDWQNPLRWPFAADSLFSIDALSFAFDLSESEKEYQVTSDLPGLEAKDINIALESNHLIISGEKKMEKKENNHVYTRVGRMVGSFRQVIPLDATTIDENKINANYKNGVLHITLPKKELLASKSRKIPIKAG